MFCPNCGEPVNDNAKFCPSCGAGLAGSQSSAAAPAPGPVFQQSIDDAKARLAGAANSVADIKIGDVPAVLAEQAGKFKEKVAPELAEQAKKLRDGAPASAAGVSAVLYEAIKAKSAQMAHAAPVDKPLYQPAPGKEATAEKTFIIGRVYQGLCVALVAFIVAVALIVITDPNFSKGVSSVSQAYDYANTLDSALGTSYKSQLNKSMGQAVFILLIEAAIAGFSIWVLYNGAKKNFAGERCGCMLMWFFALYSGLGLAVFIFAGLALGTSRSTTVTSTLEVPFELIVLAFAAVFIVSVGVIWYRRRVYAEVGY